MFLFTFEPAALPLTAVLPQNTGSGLRGAAPSSGLRPSSSVPHPPLDEREGVDVSPVRMEGVAVYRHRLFCLLQSRGPPVALSVIFTSRVCGHPRRTRTNKKRGLRPSCCVRDPLAHDANRLHTLALRHGGYFALTQFARAKGVSKSARLRR